MSLEVARRTMTVYFVFSVIFVTFILNGHLVNSSLAAAGDLGPAPIPSLISGDNSDGRMYHSDTCYIIELVNETWYDSKARCEEYNMSLTVIETEREFNMLSKVMQEANFTLLTWTGLIRNGDNIIEWENGQRLAYNKYNEAPRFEDRNKTCGWFDGKGFVMDECDELKYTFCETTASECLDYSRRVDCHGRQRECECPVWTDAKDAFNTGSNMVMVQEGFTMLYHTKRNLLGVFYTVLGLNVSIFYNGDWTSASNDLTDILVLKVNPMLPVTWVPLDMKAPTQKPVAVYVNESEIVYNIVKSKDWPKLEHLISMSSFTASLYFTNVLQKFFPPDVEVLVSEGMCGGTENPTTKVHVCYHIPENMQPTNYETAVDTCLAENSTLANLTSYVAWKEVYKELLSMGRNEDYFWAGFSDRKIPGSPVYEDGYLSGSTKWIESPSLYGGCTKINKSAIWSHVSCSDNVTYICAAGRCWGEPAQSEGRNFTIVHGTLADRILFSCSDGYSMANLTAIREFECCGKDWSTIAGPICIRDRPTENNTDRFINSTSTLSSRNPLLHATSIQYSADPSLNSTSKQYSTGPSLNRTSRQSITAEHSLNSTSIQYSTDPSFQYSTEASNDIIMNKTDRTATTEPTSTTTRSSVLTLPDVLEQCVDYPVVKNANVIGSSRRFGAVISVKCKTNHEFPDSTTVKTVTCDNRGLWGPETPPCKALTCPIAPLPPYTFRDNEDRTYGSVVTYYCRPGYKFPDGSTYRTVICKMDGVWTSEAPVCQAKDCPQGSGVPDLKAEQRVTKSCDGEKVLPDGRMSRNVFCTSTGERVPEELQTCEVRCPPTPVVGNASQEFADHSIGGKARFKCLPGHNYPNGLPAHEITCLDAGKWSQTVIEPCVEVTCPPTAKLENATSDSDRALIGSVVTYTCLKWHRFHGKHKTKVIRCMDNRQWSETPPDCKPLMCSVPPGLGNAQYTGSERTVGKRVEYTCDKGLRFPDGHTVKDVLCQEDETWGIDSNASCKANRCPPIPSADHTTTDSVTTDQGSRVKYTCQPGYGVDAVQVTQTTTCGPDLTWHDPPRDCAILSCPTFPNISNADIVGNSAHVFAKMHVRCHPGYELKGIVKNVTFECLTTQQWSVDPDSIKCERIICGELPAMNHATKSTFGVFRFRDQVWYACDEGYESKAHNDHVIAVCDERGTWVFNFPKGCLRITCPMVYSWGGMVSNSSSTDYLTRINYTCEEGYYFGDRWQYRFGTCGKGSQWHPNLETCLEEKTVPEEVVPEEAPSAPNYGAVAITMLALIVIFIITVDLISIWEAVQKTKRFENTPTPRIDDFTAIAPWPGHLVPRNRVPPKPVKSGLQPRYKPFAMA